MVSEREFLIFASYNSVAKQLLFLMIIYTSFPQLFYPLMTRQFFCDFHEKSEDFCVS